ncbi:MAG: hypothetical protein EB127_00555 [Alphaproteobacteria bacterium]|nr:hypothetical protein [Alphaproteobacteria bacterium]
MNRTSIPQIFEEVEKQTTKEAKINVLRRYDSQVLRGILEINFIDAYKMSLPEGAPPYKRDTSIPDGYSETNLFTEFRRLYIWLQPENNLSKMRKEQLFIQLLEGLHWKESDVLVHAKDKNLDKIYKSIKEPLIREAFPGLLPEKPAKPAKEAAKKDPLVG